MAHGYIPCKYPQSRSSPELRWADSGPQDHPERLETRFYYKKDPASHVSHSLEPGISRPAAKKILKVRSDPFGWPIRSRLDADSLSDDPIDWDLASMPYERKLFLTKKDSIKAMRKRKEAEELLREERALERARERFNFRKKFVAPSDRSYSNWLRTKNALRLLDFKCPVKITSSNYSCTLADGALKNTKKLIRKEHNRGYTCTPRKRLLSSFPHMSPDTFKIERLE